jgi:exopolysaccharide production protein ExoY
MGIQDRDTATALLEQPNRWAARGARACLGGRLKRAEDLLIALLALLLLGPAMLLIGAALKLQDNGPVFFVQPRVGHDGVLFPFIKFRTMVPDATGCLDRLLREDPGAAQEWSAMQKLAHDPRVTPLGRVLRRMSLDELPQFANVLLGQMSVVGPRPMLPEQVAAYGPGFALYCRARPGITGLWQVCGRSETTFQRRSELDQIYLRDWSLKTDLSLLFRTVGAVAGGRGAC